MKKIKVSIIYIVFLGVLSCNHRLKAMDFKFLDESNTKNYIKLFDNTTEEKSFYFNRNEEFSKRDELSEIENLIDKNIDTFEINPSTLFKSLLNTKANTRNNSNEGFLIKRVKTVKNLFRKCCK